MTDPTRPVSGYPTQPTNGYPPPPPPQSNYYYPNHNQAYYPHAPPQPPRATTSTFTRRLISTILFFFIILSIAYFIIWLILRPRVPIITVNSLSLTSLNISSTTSSQISATWTANFTVSNPNHKLHAYYDEIEARIYYGASLLALNQLPPFDQVVKSESSVIAKLVAVSAYIAPELVRRFDDDRSNGVVKFDVQVLALVRFKTGGWRARRRGLRAFCDDLSVSLSKSSSNGSFSGGSKRCEVAL